MDLSRSYLSFEKILRWKVAYAKAANAQSALIKRLLAAADEKGDDDTVQEIKSSMGGFDPESYLLVSLCDDTALREELFRLASAQVSGLAKSRLEAGSSRRLEAIGSSHRLDVRNISANFVKIINFFRNSLQNSCLLYTSPSPRDMRRSRMPSSA